MPPNAETVPTGPYQWYTRQEMYGEITKYKEAMSAVGSRLVSSNINGQQLTYGPRGEWSLVEWQYQIAAALALISPGEFPFPVATNAAVLVSG